MNALGSRAGAFVLAMLLGLGLGGWFAWQWQAYKYNGQLASQAQAYQQERERAALAAIEWQEGQQVQRQALEARLKVNDETHYKELIDVQKKQDRLRDRLATADLRLSVLLTRAPSSGRRVPATTDAGSLDYGAARAELDPTNAQRIIGITDDGDQGLIALAACQNYVKAVLHTFEMTRSFSR